MRERRPAPGGKSREPSPQRQTQSRNAERVEGGTVQPTQGKRLDQHHISFHQSFMITERAPALESVPYRHMILAVGGREILIQKANFRDNCVPFSLYSLRINLLVCASAALALAPVMSRTRHVIQGGNLRTPLRIQEASHKRVLFRASSRMPEVIGEFVPQTFEELASHAWPGIRIQC